MPFYDYAAVIFIGVFGTGFLGGYLCARLDYLYVRLREWHAGASQIPQATGFFAQRMATTPRPPVGTPLVAEKIDIDTRTVVTEINTAGIQKGSDVEMGTTTAQQDNIGASVSRLSQLKGK
jgi:hypothetical protein